MICEIHPMITIQGKVAILPIDLTDKIDLSENWIWLEIMKGKTTLDHCKISPKIVDYDQEIKWNDHQKIGHCCSLFHYHHNHDFTILSYSSVEGLIKLINCLEA